MSTHLETDSTKRKLQEEAQHAYRRSHAGEDTVLDEAGLSEESRLPEQCELYVEDNPKVEEVISDEDGSPEKLPEHLDSDQILVDSLSRLTVNLLTQPPCFAMLEYPIRPRIKLQLKLKDFDLGRDRKRMEVAAQASVVECFLYRATGDSYSNVSEQLYGTKVKVCAPLIQIPNQHRSSRIRHGFRVTALGHHQEAADGYKLYPDNSSSLLYIFSDLCCLYPGRYLFKFVHFMRCNNGTFIEGQSIDSREFVVS